MPPILNLTPELKSQLQELKKLPINLVTQLVIEGIRNHNFPVPPPLPLLPLDQLVIHLITNVTPLPPEPSLDNQKQKVCTNIINIFDC